MIVIFMRHGETEMNKARLAQGWSDSYLTTNGQQQVSLAAEKMKNILIDKIYSSPLGRTMTTSKAVKKYHNVPFQTSSLIMEYSMGIYEGTDLDTEEWAKKREDYYLGKIKFEDGESLEDVEKRLDTFFEKLLSNHNDNECVLVTSHGGVMHSLLMRGVDDPNSRISIIDKCIPNTGTLQFKLSKNNEEMKLDFIDFEDLPKNNA